MALSGSESPAEKVNALRRDDTISSRRVRLGTLNNLRWMAIAGQSAALIVASNFLGLELPLLLCVAPIIASAVLNLVLAASFPATRRLTSRGAAGFLAYDIVQLTALLYLTGGIQNPFALLYIAPVVVAAATLDVTSTVLLGALSFIAVSLLANFHFPLPWADPDSFRIPVLYNTGIWVSLLLGIGFTSIYAWRTATESARMLAALAATQLALSREHRLAALGSLAAAAAHELGTPLSTIALVSRELERDAENNPKQADDFRLLRDEAERCRAILTRLAHPEEAVLGNVEQLQLGALLDDLAAPHRGVDIAISVDVQKDSPVPRVWRVPEILHALQNLIENAADFATREVVLRARWTDSRLIVEVADDGPGFSPQILAQIGEPYITSRPRKRGSPDSGDDNRQEGMGLGFFIAKTLIERTGGRTAVKNRPGGGAMVTLSWPRGAIDGKTPPSQQWP
jgi:two-component system sensor histidine kinase RegB